MPVIIPTKRCNLRCKHCLRDEYHSGDLNPELLEKFLLEFTKHSSQRKLHSFTGGEPTIHGELGKLLNAFRKTKHSLYIVSNGQSKKGVETIIKNKDVIDYMSLSLDAPTEDLNDMTRGKGTFKKVVEHTKIYLNNKIEVDYRFVIHDRNAHTMEDAFLLAEKMGIKRIRFSTLHPVAKGQDNNMIVHNDVLILSYKKMLELRKKYKNISAGMNTRHMIPYLQPEWVKDFCTPIGGPLNGITILPDGKICFCCDLVDNDFINDRYTADNKWLDPIIGDFNYKSIDVIKQNKMNRIRELRKRRRNDVANEKITDTRKFICENCKFYHYKNKPLKNLD